VAAALLIIVVLFAFVGLDFFSKKAMPTEPEVFVGVDVGYGDANTVYQVANAVAGYANLIVLGSLELTQNTTALLSVCDFLYARGFYFIIYVGFGNFTYVPPRGPDPNFFNATYGRWGNKFLGIYLFDEIGGKQLDAEPEKPVEASQVAPVYVQNHVYSYVSQAYISTIIGDTAEIVEWYTPPYPDCFLSDYALYWFDYLGGYQTVFAEFDGNMSRQIAISMCRGAAHTLGMNAGHTQGQEWGVIITWKYDQPPFLENGSQLYSDMVLAYENDAKYIIVFNSPDNSSIPGAIGTLTNDQLSWMQRFWAYIKANPRSSSYPADVAYVLPSDYGYGMRGPNDTIWGIWPADNNSSIIWSEANSLLSTYGSKLDIVYATKTSSEAITLPYSKLIFWNGTVIQK